MKRMLINATQDEELRVAMVDGQRLYDLDIDVSTRAQRKANIYKGKVTRVEPSLEAAFVNYGADRHGFLPLKEISREYFVADPGNGDKVNIKDVLKEGQDIVVQVEKEERGNKGAALTTFISLAGRFIVLMPNNPRAGGVSRRITGEDRDVVRESLDGLELPDGMGCIIRTAGVGRSEEELSWDLTYLLSIWDAIKQVVVDRPSPFLIYQENNAITRALRDYLSSDVGEILIDGEQLFSEAKEFVERMMPHNLRRLKFYDDPHVPLFTRYQIESQIESAFAHTVNLPSGGSIVIDHTEALTAIDINSARATKGGDIEATAFNTNLEAAEEIARQMRIRDLGGLVVIDFIDMGPQKNQRDVENKLREAVRQDRARIQIGRISRFGLLELSRQRLRPSLGESTHSICSRCNGVGRVRSTESLALAILRLVGEEARKERTAKVIAQLPVDVCNYLLNEKREWVYSLEQRVGVAVILVANTELETPNYSIKRVRDDETQLPENTGASFQLAESTAEDPAARFVDKSPQQPASHQPAVGQILPSEPAPEPKAKPVKPRSDSEPGLWQKLLALFGIGAKPAQPGKRKSGSRGTRQRSGRGSGSGGNRSRKPKRNQDRRAKGSDTKSESSKPKRQGSSNSERKASNSGGGNRGRRGNRRRRGGSNRNKSGDAKASATQNNGASKKGQGSQQQSKAPQQERANPARTADAQASGPKGEQGKTSKPPAETKPAASAPEQSTPQPMPAPKQAAPTQPQPEPTSTTRKSDAPAATPAPAKPDSHPGAPD